MTATLEAQAQQTITLTYQPKDGPPVPKTFVELIPAPEIRQDMLPVALALGQLITDNPGQVINVPIMSGATQTMDTLMELATPEYPEIDPAIKPIKLERYHGVEAADKLVVVQDLPDDGSIKDKIVILYDEVVDNFVAAEYAINRARELGARVIIFVTVTNKPDAHKPELEELPDYFITIYDVSNKFLLGFGMDVQNKGRWLKSIYVEADGAKATYTKRAIPELVV